MQLSGKVAIVTGASSGIGYAAARLSAQEGARVVVVAGDVRHESTVQAAVEAAVNRFGGLDIALNNAATLGKLATVPDLEPRAWQEVLDVNLSSAFLGARHQIPAMLERGGGSILFTSTSVGHTVGFPGMGAYAASKAGVIGLVRVIAAVLAGAVVPDV